MATSSRPALVAMVQAADLGDREDPPLLWPLHPSRLRRILLQAQVGSAAVVVGEVVCEQTVQVGLVEHDDMVQAFAPNRPDQPFHIRRLPGATRRDTELGQAQGLGAAPELQAINAIPVVGKTPSGPGGQVESGRRYSAAGA